MHIIWPKCVRNDFIKMRTLKKCTTLISLLFAGKDSDLSKILKGSARGGDKCDFKESGPVPSK